MKKYQTLSNLDHKQTTQQTLDELEVFQYLLRNSAELSKLYQNKALEIADGLQPWIDALVITLKK